MNTQENNSTADTPVISHHETIKTVHSVRRWVVVLATVVVASWVVIGFAIFKHNTSSAADGNLGGIATTKPMRSGQGSWGQLEYTPIVISAPLEYVTEGAVDYSGPVVWHVPNVGSRGLSALLKSIGLKSMLTVELETMSRANVSLPGMSLYPSREFIVSLGAEDRAKLYLTLADYGQNIDIRAQFLFHGESPDEWFAGSGVSAETRKLVEPLIYRHGDFMCFADMRSIFADIPSRDQ
jgi:hypothetical protein